MLPYTPIAGETVILLESLSDSGQLFFLGSVFLLGGFVFRRLRSAIVQSRASFSPKRRQPPEQVCAPNS